MNELISLDKFEQDNKKCISVPSPVSCIRNKESFLEAIGSDIITIDGEKYKILDVQMYMPLFKLRSGEPITLMVEKDDN